MVKQPQTTKKSLLILFVILLVTGGESLWAKTNKIRQLREKYQQWWELVTYIITKEERTTFLKLTNDRDRDVFINLFWNLRDSTPGTEANEFKEEHIRRFRFANQYFKYGTPRKGWQTDMGRIYIILGEPASKDRYDMGSVVVPAQIWSYYGKNPRGLPSSFNIVFWKPHGAGEYKIYDPASDGPYSLIKPTKAAQGLDPTDIKACYQTIREEHPALAQASLTLIPDELPYGFTPSIRSQQLLGKVMELPLRQINDTYATNFLKYKGKVSVDYSINFVESRHSVLVTKDLRTGLNFVHFALRPNNISAQSSPGDNTYFFNFELNVSLHKGDRPIFEYRKKFPFSGEKDEVLQKFSNSLIISDFFPVAEGDYRLSALLQNKVNKEFTFFEKDISIPPVNHSKPFISGLLLSKEVKRIPRYVFLPFKFRDMEVTPDPRKEFGSKDNIVALVNLEPGNTDKPLKAVMEVQNIFDPGKYKKEYTFEIPPAQQREIFSRELGTLAPGYYRVTVRLLTADGTVLDEKKEDFTISVSAHVAGTTHLFKATPVSNQFLYYHILALQYMRLKKPDQAETYFNKALQMQPDYPRLIKDYCMLLLEKKRPDSVLKIVENLKTREKEQFDYYALRGKALFQKAQYKEAIKNLAEANRIYDSDASVLNFLGMSYLETGNKEEAKEVFAASLRIDDQQKDIARLLEKLK
jgi:GWxTD domain-containing protein